jgi:hypothetical protein
LAVYRRDLRALPTAALVRRMIKGRPHFYAVIREGGTVRYEYRGRLASSRQGDRARLTAKQARYRKLIAILEARIVRLRSEMRDEDRPPA